MCLHTAICACEFSATRYVYPDFSVVRVASREWTTTQAKLTLLNPVFVVEVTSPSSSQTRDRIDKLDLYY